MLFWLFLWHSLEQNFAQKRKTGINANLNRKFKHLTKKVQINRYTVVNKSRHIEDHKKCYLVLKRTICKERLQVCCVFWWFTRQGRWGFEVDWGTAWCIEEGKERGLSGSPWKGYYSRELQWFFSMQQWSCKCQMLHYSNYSSQTNQTFLYCPLSFKSLPMSPWTPARRTWSTPRGSRLLVTSCVGR